MTKPYEQKVLEGTARPDRDGSPEERPVYPLRLPGAPDYVVDDERAYAEWQRITHELAESGVLRSTDQEALAMYCCLSSDFAKERMGEAVKKMPAQQQTLYVRLMSDLGLTPVGRSRVRLERTVGQREPKKEEPTRGFTRLSR